MATPKTSDETMIDYWSYSSMNLFLRNPLAFKKKYILKIYDDIMSPSAVVGTAGHRALEAYLNGKDQGAAKEAGMDYINNLSDAGIDYGKTGSREQIINSYSQAIEFYFAEFEMPYKILGVEYEIVAPLETIDGQKLALPAKSFSDVITENQLGEIEVIDHKFVRTYTDPNIDDFTKFLQAMFLYHTVKAKFGKAPSRVIFNECKISKNKDGSRQIVPWTFEFDQIGNFATFYKLYDAATSNVNLPGFSFLPNPGDLFDGQNSFEVFRTGVIGIEAPVSVKHAAQERKYVEKKFAASSFEQPQGENFSPEGKIESKLLEFGVPVKHEATHVGPSVTKYTFKPSRGVQMRKVAGFGNDLALALSAKSVRIEAPIFGTNLIGVEIPNVNRTVVELANSHLKAKTMQIPIGVDVYGTTIHKALNDMPHLLIAGATGSGKSVMLNVILDSLTKQMPASDLKLTLIDPKQVELAGYEGSKHVDGKVITDIRDAVVALDKLVKEMDKRYEQLRAAGVRNIEDLHRKGGKMPYRVIIVDEFADLMMSDLAPSADTMDIKAFKTNLEWAVADGSGKLTQKAIKEALKVTLEKDTPPSAQDSIIRIAQKARAVGMHLVLATQRPSADVVTGLIKANIPTKIAFMATSQVNSKIILDQAGAETLIGKGDMLFLDPSANGLVRLQGLYA